MDLNELTELINLKSINTIVGVFLLIIAVAGNFIAETLSCQAQKLLSTNMIAKNIVILIVIYFAIDFTAGEGVISPSEALSRTLIIWIFFLVFNKMDIEFACVVFLLLFYILIANNAMKYYKTNKKNEKLIKRIYLSIKIVFFVLVVTMLTGFGLYFNKQYSEYKNTFSFMNFILGKTNCKSI